MKICREHIFTTRSEPSVTDDHPRTPRALLPHPHVVRVTLHYAGVRKWLYSIGLGQYAESFEGNAIELDQLATLSDEEVERAWRAGFWAPQGG